MPGYTPRLGLPYPLSTESPNGPTQLEALAFSSDDLVVWGQGVLALRPISTSGSPGIQGRLYLVIGDGAPANNGILWQDYGTGWEVVGAPPTIVDVRANRPSAASVPVGQRFFATDQVAEWIASSSSWVRMGVQPGVITINFTAGASPGSIFCTGQPWPSLTGIYADLYALWGEPATLPNFSGFVPVGVSPGDAHFGYLQGHFGETQHALSLGEVPVEAYAGGAPTGSGFSYAQVAGAAGAHNNIQPSLVVYFEAKL